MWQVGFFFWALWQMTKWTVVSAVVLFVLYLWGGFNGAFLLGVLGVALGLWGLKRTLGGYHARESADRRGLR